MGAVQRTKLPCHVIKDLHKGAVKASFGSKKLLQLSGHDC